MSVLLATLCLNEMEWLPRLYRQHKDWPELAQWVFVEAADRVYAEANPGTVNGAGLSTDGTSEFLEQLTSRDSRVVYIKHGFSEDPDPAKGKIAARQRYLEVAGQVAPQFVIGLDADEFYTREDQGRLIEVMRGEPSYHCFTFPKREIWRPPSLAQEPLLRYEAVGGFWGIPCCHWWRWSRGLYYQDCHNIPCHRKGWHLNDRIGQLHNDLSKPQMLHLGFASERVATRLAKNRYYAERGEAADPQRSWYVESRAAWEKWRPGERLPRGARIALYDGPVPEIFCEGNRD